MRHSQNVVRIGSPGSGKTVATARSVLDSDGAEVIIDPHPDGLVSELLPHVGGNVLHEDLSSREHALGYDLLVPSAHPDPEVREEENQAQAETFTEILVQRRGPDGLGALQAEWVGACLQCYLNQAGGRPARGPASIPSLLQPGDEDFERLVSGCTIKSLTRKFRALEKLTPRGLRQEVSSTARLLHSVFRSPYARPRFRGGFDLGAFLESGGKLLVERGRKIGGDPMRLIMGAVILLTRAHAERRPSPLPTIRLRVDEAANAGLLSHDLRGPSETNKWGLYWEYCLQRDPGGGLLEDLLQLCPRHEWYLCSARDLARKAALDFDAGLPPAGDEETRAQRVERLTTRFMNLKPGERGVKDADGSRFERVARPESPWPPWPGLHEAKVTEKLQCIHSRKEYAMPATRSPGAPSEPPSSPSSPSSPPRHDSSPGGSSPSPAERWRRLGKPPREHS